MSAPSTRSVRDGSRRGIGWRRALGTATALAATLGLLCTGADGPATATSTAPGSATAQSAAVTNGTGVTLSATGTGATGALAAALLNSSLATASANLPNTVTSAVTSGLTGTVGLQATNASTGINRPTPVTNYPACGQQQWVYPAGNCYAVINTASTPAVPVGSLFAASAGTVQGYATGDDQGYVSASASTDPVIAVPGLSIDLGVAASNVQCSTAFVCTPSHSFTGGKVTTVSGTQSTTQTFSLASGSTLATLGSTTIPSGGTIPVAGNVVTATANGNFLTFAVALTLGQYLGAIGTSLSALSGGLTGSLLGDVLNDNGSAITLAITVGPGSISPSNASSANAWGLDVGVNLIADIKLNLNAASSTTLLGGVLTTITGKLLGSTELVTSGASSYPASAGSAPNLLDLKLAYSQGTAGALLPDFIPPGLI